MTPEERVAFMNGPPITLSCGEENITLRPRMFASGSVGYHGNGKWTVHGWRCQVNFILTVVGSKPDPVGEQLAIEALTAPATPRSPSEPEKAIRATGRRQKGTDGR